MMVRGTAFCDTENTLVCDLVYVYGEKEYVHSLVACDVWNESDGSQLMNGRSEYLNNYNRIR
jgi:hypothetical protein